MGTPIRETASFRDPSGFLFRTDDGTLLRQVNKAYEADFRRLNESGLYQLLVDRGWLVAHEQREINLAVSDDASRVLQPMEIPFVSYPYEWCFSALKAAALLTLDIQRVALEHGMSLKDASAYNVQFEGTRPVFIDTLSFETYRQDKPWNAYGQFCRHFLAPLALMAKGDIRHGQLLRSYVDGIPLDLARDMLPWTTMFSPSLQFHIRMHARMVAKHADSSKPHHATQARQAKVSLTGLQAILASLRSAVAKLQWLKPSQWSNYYEDNSYSSVAFEKKQETVRRWLSGIQPDSVWDLGANTGVYSQIAAKLGCQTIAFDIDPACVEINFQESAKLGLQNMLPLILDLTNPTPSLGWAHQERKSLVDRGPADAVMALALLHHLAIANNVPFGHIADYLVQLGRHLIVEFVPKRDVQAQRLLLSREDIFRDYDQDHFEQAFERRFHLRDTQPLDEGGRCLYLMEVK